MSRIRCVRSRERSGESDSRVAPAWRLIGAVLVCLAVNVPTPSDVIAWAQTDASRSLNDNAPRTQPATGSQLAVYHPDADHPWNRLFVTLYTRPGPDGDDRPNDRATKLVGGDMIDFPAWGGTTYWSSPEIVRRLLMLLDEFPGEHSSALLDDPVKRAMMLRDLWAVFDFLADQNMRRVGSLKTRQQRRNLCRRLAAVISQLTLTTKQIAELPDTYAVAIRSGHFVPQPVFDDSADYLPAELLRDSDSWVEIEFFQPDLHEDLSLRFVTMHTREFVGRSYFRIFYRFPGGRAQLVRYLARLEKSGVDWKQAAQNGFILLKPDAPQIPVGTEVALIQFMMTLDKDLRPAPTRIVESIRHRFYRSVDGSDDLKTNTGRGMHVTEYTLKRRLLFDGLRHGGLYREPMDEGQYRMIFQPDDAPDWGTIRDKVLFQQCADCHMTPKGTRVGVHSIPSIVNMGGFDAGAQLGIAVALDPSQDTVRGRRAARWKSQHESYRRLLELLER